MPAALSHPPAEGIYDTLKECACISKSAGGIGLSMHNIRATGSYIRGTNGTSNGIVPMLRVFNDTGRQVLKRSLPLAKLCMAEGPTCLPAPPILLCSPLCGPGRRQAQGSICHVLRAVACRHL